MVSEKYLCIFIHIPKTAGQSIEHFFLNLHGLNWESRAPLLLKHNADPKLGPESLAHLNAEEYVRYGHLSKIHFDSYFKFSFVRNPWDRVLSEYFYRNYHHRYSFEDFIISGFPEKNNYSDAYRHIQPQYEYLYDQNGNCMVDFIGKFETLQSDFNYICKKLNIEDTSLPYIYTPSIGRERIHKATDLKNPEKRRDYTSYYNQKLQKVIADRYEKDISLFQYTFC